MKSLCGVLVLMLLAGNCFAEISDDKAVKALAGEAGGQSMNELYAHACALHNRGVLTGVYGIRKNSSDVALNRARIAWNRVKNGGVDVVKGCDHWLSDYDLKHSRESLIAWRKNAVYEIKVGKTTFYKLRKN